MCVQSYVPESEGLGHSVSLALSLPVSVSPLVGLCLSISLSLSLLLRVCGSVTGVPPAQCSPSLRVSECAPVSGSPHVGLPLSQSPRRCPCFPAVKAANHSRCPLPAQCARLVSASRPHPAPPSASWYMLGLPLC